MLWQRIVISFFLLLNLAAWELLFWQPQNYYFWLALLILVILLANRALSQVSWRQARFWQLVSLPLSFNLAAFCFLLFWEGEVTRQVLAVLAVLFTGVWWEIFAYHFTEARRVQIIAGYFSWLTLFLFSAALYNFSILIGVPFYWLLLAFLLFGWWLFWQVGWWWGLSAPATALSASVLSLIFTELFWSLSFWPTSAYINALVLAIFYYLVLELIAVQLLQTKVIWRQQWKKFIIAGVALIIALLSAQWV